MNSSTLPPLLGNYLPSYEPKSMISMARVHLTGAGEADPEEDINCSSNEVEKKQKSLRAVLAHKRRMEAEQKAFKEKEEKALHTLKMWNVVKQNERKRKQRLLQDRVNLQHQIIKKQDELHEVLVENQQREEKERIQSPHLKFQKPKLKSERTHKAPNELKKPQQKTKVESKVNRKKPVHEHVNEKAISETFEELSEISEKDTFSEEDLSEFLEHSTIEEVDFHELRYKPLNMQLERLFGEKAESYLNPTVKESPRKVLDPTLAKQSGQQGARALWESLRDYSRQKLRNKDALILPDVKNAYACFVRECLRRHITPVKRNYVSEEESPVNVNVEESVLLKDVRFRRHRQELMYRIAHVNKDKTRLLLQSTGPHYIDTKTQDGLRRYYPQLTENQGNQFFPSITLEDDQGKPCLVYGSADINSKKSRQLKPENLQAEKLPQVLGSKLVFLTEEKASCRGQFAKRLAKDDKKEKHIDSKQPKVIDALCEQKNKNPEFLQRLWEPLSMDALVEHKNSFSEKPDGTNRILNASRTLYALT